MDKIFHHLDFLDSNYYYQVGSFLVCSYWGGTDCLPRSLLHHTRHRQVINIISSKDILGGTKEQVGPKHNGQKVLFAVMGPNFILIIGTDSIFTSNHNIFQSIQVFLTFQISLSRLCLTDEQSSEFEAIVDFFNRNVTPLSKVSWSPYSQNRNGNNWHCSSN